MTQKQLDLWNQKHPKGTPILVKKDNGSVFETKTTSVAWMFQHGHAVVIVEGISGCYDLERVTVK